MNGLNSRQVAVRSAYRFSPLPQTKRFHRIQIFPEYLFQKLIKIAVSFSSCNWTQDYATLPSFYRRLHILPVEFEPPYIISVRNFDFLMYL